MKLFDIVSSCFTILDFVLLPLIMNSRELMLMSLLRYFLIISSYFVVILKCFIVIWNFLKWYQVAL